MTQTAETKPEEKQIQFCERCFATMDWQVPHCFNCGAGGAGVIMLQRQADEIRKGASWVGKRFYTDNDDRELNAELRALRRAIGTYPGRSAMWRPANERGPGYWSLEQSRPGTGCITTTVDAPESMKAEEVIAKYADRLPWGGPR